MDFTEKLNFNIKREPSPPSTPEDRSPHDIRAKLKHHLACKNNGNNQDETESNLPSSENIKERTKDAAESKRQKRPYHKRADKTKLPLSSSLQQQPSESATTQRKYKPKFKQVMATDSQDDNSMNASSLNAGTISGDEDEGGHENDLRPGREKEKCPDVLAMVLSMKKRALMENPEVQQFLAEVMNVIKS